jgi:hypothetical protein
MMRRQRAWRLALFLVIALIALWWFSANGSASDSEARSFVRHFLRALGRALH